MGVISHTVTSNNNLISFRSAARVPITSLKCYFKPVQEGEGDPSPDNIRPIKGWNGVDIYQDNINLPIEYQRVEWIESTGTQWIDTGIVPDGFTKAQLKVMNKKVTGDVIFGCYGESDTTDWRLFNYNSSIYLDCPGPPSLGVRIIGDPNSFMNNYIYEFEIGYSYVKDLRSNTIIKGTARNEDFDRAAAGPITLNNYYNKTYSSNRWYYVKIFDHGTLVRDMIPCIRKTDSKPGMYDMVSGEFLVNLGTGEFIYGPDIDTIIPVKFSSIGKNKFDYTNTTFIQGIRDIDGSFLDDNVSHYTEQFIPVLPSTEYTLSGNNLYSGGYVVRVYYSDENKNWISKTPGDRTNTLTFTTPANCYYIQIQTNSNNTHPNTWQLELGSVATDYEPYDNIVYGGYINPIKGELVQTHTIYIFTGEEPLEKTNYLLNPMAYIFDSRYNNSIAYTATYELSEVACNKLNFETGRYHNVHKGCIAIGKSNQTVSILFNDTDVFGSTATEAQAKLAEWYDNGEPMIIVAKLQEAYYVHHPLPPVQLKTLLDRNYIWSNTNDITEVSYAIHDSAPIRAAKHRIAANEPRITTATGSLANFKTDMAAALKTCKVYFGPKQEGEGDPSPDNIRPISGWDKLNIYHHNKQLIQLPNEYQEVEYIKTPGPWNWNDRDNPRTTQAYICTQLQFSNIEKIVCKYKVLSYTQMNASWSPMYIASHDNSSTNPMAPYATVERMSGFVSVNPIISPPFTGIEHVYTIVPGTSNEYMRIGGWSDIQWTAEGAYYYVYAYGKNDVEIAKFIPCYRKVDNIAGMYEIISNTFYPSDGNENFIAGPECETNNILADWSSTAGTIYGGYIDLINGTLVKTYVKQNLGVMTWTASTYHSYVTYNLLTSGMYVDANTLPNCYCEEMTVKALNDMRNNYLSQTSDEYWITCSSSATIIAAPAFNDMTDAEVNNFMQGKYLSLKLPPERWTTYQLTPTQLKTLCGTNNIWSNANGPVEVKYWTH